MIYIRDTLGNLRQLNGIWIRDTGNVLRQIRSVFIRDTANVLKQVFSSFAATASPNFVSGSAASGGSVNVVTDNATATPNGGTAPYTYAWALLADDGLATWVAVSPSAQTTAFRASGVSAGDSTTATFSCAVTDATATTVTTAVVTANAENYGNYDGYL